jgi:hypothetical protein
MEPLQEGVDHPVLRIGNEDLGMPGATPARNSDLLLMQKHQILMQEKGGKNMLHPGRQRQAEEGKTLRQRSCRTSDQHLAADVTGHHPGRVGVAYSTSSKRLPSSKLVSIRIRQGGRKSWLALVMVGAVGVIPKRKPSWLEAALTTGMSTYLASV